MYTRRKYLTLPYLTSYVVQLGGTSLRRKRQFLKPARETSNTDANPDNVAHRDPVRQVKPTSSPAKPPQVATFLKRQRLSYLVSRQGPAAFVHQWDSRILTWNVELFETLKGWTVELFETLSILVFFLGLGSVSLIRFHLTEDSVLIELVKLLIAYFFC